MNADCRALCGAGFCEIQRDACRKIHMCMDKIGDTDAKASVFWKQQSVYGAFVRSRKR